jgi:hypothetical protein
VTTIYAALAAVMEDVRAVRKGDRNTQQNYSFRGIDAVVNAVGPALRTHGVAVMPLVQNVDYDVVQTSNGKPQTACRVLVDYVFHGPDGDSLTARVIGEAWDSGDKAAPKAMSVAFRTALLQALALPTDEPDPDSQTYERANAHPDPMTLAKEAVRSAWLMHHQTWDPVAMRDQYEQQYASSLDDASPEDLHSFARVLSLPPEPVQEALTDA